MGIPILSKRIEAGSRARIAGPAIGALCALLCVPCSCIDSPRDTGQVSVPAIGANALMTGANYGLLTWDNKALFNNCWGIGLLESADLATSVVFYDPASSTCGWRWSFPREAVTELKAYPCLIVGDKVYTPAGYDPSTDPRFPLHLPLIKSLWALGDIRVAGGGDFDFAYDLAFLEGSFSAPKAVRSEIMVWLVASKECPARKEGEYIIEGCTYDFFVNTDWNPGIPYLAFILECEALPLRLPLHEFIRIGIDKGYVGPDAYLAAVELGPEIWWGEGKASVHDYRISLNGD
jgi:hypothetical protein